MVSVLWSHPDGRVAQWRIDDLGDVFVKEHRPPAPGLTVVNATDSAILWRYPDGGVTIWQMDPEGNKMLHFGKKKGPYEGWRAVNCTRTGGDVTRWLGSMIWHHTDGRISLWNIDQNLDVDHLGFKESGPYSGWTPLQLEGDNLLWQRGDGRISYWKVSQDGLNGGYTEHGPFPGWSVVGCTKVSGTAERRLLWRNTDGRISYWAVTSTGELAKYGAHPEGYVEHGPIPGWIAIGCGHDRILWHDPANRRISVWRMGADLRMAGSHVYPVHTSRRALDAAPDADWRLVSISSQ